MKLNTSNAAKRKEFEEIFQSFGISLICSNLELKEIDADPLTVIRHKVSQVPKGVIIDDTIIDVENAPGFGIHTKKDLNKLPLYVGHKVAWTVRLAIQKESEQVFIFQGVVKGTIVAPKGDQTFGFDGYFLPEGALKTLGEEKTPKVNARYLAVEALVKNRAETVTTALYEWDGGWQ